MPMGKNKPAKRDSINGLNIFAILVENENFSQMMIELRIQKAIEANTVQRKACLKEKFHLLRIIKPCLSVSISPDLVIILDLLDVT